MRVTVTMDGTAPDTSVRAIRPPMTYRTGRNVVLSVKTTQATVDAFYDLPQRKGWKAGETFEKVIACLIASEGA
jgi:hypothetical protein